MTSRHLISLLQRIAGRFGFTVKRRRPGIIRESGEALRSITPASLMAAIHGRDIYQGFDHTAYAPDRSGWGGESEAFGEIIRSVRPSFVIEVGTWKGASALTMAELMESEGIEGSILCVDTWLGALEFWSDQSDRR